MKSTDEIILSLWWGKIRESKQEGRREGSREESCWQKRMQGNKYRRNDRVTKLPSSTPNEITDSGKKDH